MDQRIRVGIVNYLNTLPLLYGIKHSAIIDKIELLTYYPSKIADLLISHEIDIGLVPVAVIPELKEYHILTDYCIGSDGAVGSVCIFSEVSIDKVEKVFLDYQSRTSVDLARILIKDYWKIHPQLISTSGEYQSEIKGTTAGLLIGDRALKQRKVSKYIYDLGEAWKLFTGLPFVFAAWVSNKQLPGWFISDFNSANEKGYAMRENLAETSANTLVDLRKYFTEFISYKLDERKRRGLNLFLEMIKQVKVV